MDEPSIQPIAWCPRVVNNILAPKMETPYRIVITNIYKVNTMGISDEPTCARCPFCGSADLQLVESVIETGTFVACLTCEGAGPPAETAQLALEKWCHRAGTAEVLGYNVAIGSDYLT